MSIRLIALAGNMRVVRKLTCCTPSPRRYFELCDRVISTREPLPWILARHTVGFFAN